mmetsp:Transcript_41397/g.128988  ORF Transcript_41397/g.128988 Transcript_41397/m.128988 type:complete len:353 (+) Transcript_41397:1025-2083(+)
MHQVQEPFGSDEVPRHGDLRQLQVAPGGPVDAVHLHHEPALRQQDGQAPDRKEELHEVHLAGAGPEGVADGPEDRLRVEEGEAAVHVRRLHEGAEEAGVDDVGHVADPDVHVPPRSAPIPVKQLVPLGIGELGLVVPPHDVVLVEGKEVVALVQQLPHPVRQAVRREAHAGGQRVPADALALRLGRDGADQRHRRVGRLAEEVREVLLPDVCCQLLAAHALLPGLADMPQEAGYAVRVVVDEDTQRGGRHRGGGGELRLRHPPEGDPHLQRRVHLRLPLPAAPLHLLLQHRYQAAGARLEGQVQRGLAIQVPANGGSLLQQEPHHPRPAPVALGEDRRVQHVVVRPLVPRDP